jgi:predicted AAA+ superfamily ATPase
MTLKPWRELITPHKDVLDGTFKQSEFAADLTQVQNGTAPEEYKNAEKFFRRTYITEGMRLLLDSVARRIAGKGGDPVIQLQTSFGGGKTHTLLAVYHLAKREVSPEKLAGIPPILDKAGVSDLPSARVAVVDGNNISPSMARVRGTITVKTLWGEIAWQLLGEPGFQIVAAADRDGTSPGKEALIELIKKAAPCVVLLDELVAFVRQLESGKSYVAGTFESNMSFIQALTEAMKSVPNALLLASLPESEIETAGPMGKLALESLEKYFARVESVWKPVATEEAFEIVKRRLFESSSNPAEIERVCKSFFDYYIANNNKFPEETQASRYHERLLQSYPIHPEVFDRLYSDWSTLEKFQRTRGVLQYLAIVIHRLWNSDNRDPMIMPGAIPLDDVNVRTKSIHYLPQGWEPVIESEIDGQRSVAAEIDAKEPRIGALHAATRVARTVFLGSAPSAHVQGARGIALDRILLGAAQPGQVVAVYEDALKRLLDRLQYLFPGNNRYWFDTRPNLRREMESRKTRLDGRDHINPCLKDFVGAELRGSSSFSGIHVFTPSSDIPDEIGSGPRLVVLEPESLAAYSKANAITAYDTALKILEKRGDQPRQRRNRLLFLACDYDSLGRLKDNARTYLAWKSITDDIEDEKLNLDMHNQKQAVQAFEQSKKVLSQSIRDAYKWLLNPFEEMAGGRPVMKWEVTPVSSGGSSFIAAIENKLKEEEWVIYEWSPIHLSNVLKQWYFKEGQSEVITRKLLNDFASYLYLPRLASEAVLKTTISQGIIADEFFGYAQGRSEGRYSGLTIGAPAQVIIDEISLLVERDAATRQRDVERNEAAARMAQAGVAGALSGSQTSRPIGVPTAGSSDPASSQAKKTYFFATKELSGRTPKVDFSEVMEKIHLQLSSRSTTSVGIQIEITATDESGFEKEFVEEIQKLTAELKFKASDFSIQ